MELKNYYYFLSRKYESPSEAGFPKDFCPFTLEQSIMAFKEKFEAFTLKAPNDKDSWLQFWENNKPEILGFANFIQNHQGRIYEPWLKEIFGKKNFTLLAEGVLTHKLEFAGAEERLMFFASRFMKQVQNHPEVEEYADIISKYFYFFSQKELKAIYKKLRIYLKKYKNGVKKMKHKNAYVLFLVCKHERSIFH